MDSLLAFKSLVTTAWIFLSDVILLYGGSWLNEGLKRFEILNPRENFNGIFSYYMRLLVFNVWRTETHCFLIFRGKISMISRPISKAASQVTLNFVDKLNID